MFVFLNLVLTTNIVILFSRDVSCRLHIDNICSYSQIFSTRKRCVLVGHPYATIVIITCKDFSVYKMTLKSCLNLTIQNDAPESFIVFVSKAYVNNDQESKLTMKIYTKHEVDFSSKNRE